MCEDNEEYGFAEESPYIDLAVEVFSLLADATRVRIILALRDCERPVGELAEIVGKTPTVVSQHLAKMRLGRIVQARQEGRKMFYSLVNEHARTLVMQAVYQAQHAVEDNPLHPHWEN
ncbi:metalloregulator ArsR/SmtB family transcription factor [Corynebacterium poyangense]|uniref:Metalloregulator ArsR/SmtB family transcription factor n=1 Tax=Corynebacterium poyangense TaxID=2684405 RepID=A0A7H0SQD7_9CORY|nr:metalloregulator ArsR/SmtB family transcription factor [Corynebacterium poyangense]MBZ8178355.1 metalloregulator ArsR/SmtB family transcription factor [Corynebacterium poyangense]QNQ90762.1 metalloregulator ArsR/SmtB family transcription factor [Corynebacterium poyangense]